LQGMARFKTRMKFVRTGQCTQCGECEKAELNQIKLRCYQLFGLEGKIIHPDPCPYLRWEENKAVCTIYNSADRPWQCREFPTSPIDLIALPGCGYSFLDSEGRDMMATLREMALEKAEREGFADVACFLRKMKETQTC